MITAVRKDKLSLITIFLFSIILVWWIVLYLGGTKTGFPNYLFAAIGGPFMSLLGGAIGLYTSRQWGGCKSVMGKAIFFLSLGLLAEFFGQIIFSTYNILLRVEIPYPSLADIGYFANIPLYFIGILLLAKASGIKIGSHSIHSKILVLIFPSAILLFSYLMFLKDYDFSTAPLMNIILDFGYPLGQALYVSIALLTYTLTQKSLGGIMRNQIFLLLIAFFIQYLSDFNFLFQNSRGTWYNGGYGDLLYIFAYFVMALGLLQLKSTAREIHHSV